MQPFRLPTVTVGPREDKRGPERTVLGDLVILRQNMHHPGRWRPNVSVPNALDGPQKQDPATMQL